MEVEGGSGTLMEEHTIIDPEFDEFDIEDLIPDADYE